MGKFMLLLLVWDIVALFAIILRPNFKYSSDVISWLIAGIVVCNNNNQLVIRWINMFTTFVYQRINKVIAV